MNVPTIFIIVLAVIFIIGGPLFASYAGRVHENENKTNVEKKSAK